MKFFKMHGAGNDFIFFAGKTALSPDDIRKLCHRNTGIGADGVVIIEELYKSCDFMMKYYNSDGSRADFCANAARCAVRIASELKFFEGKNCVFKASDGIHKAQILKNGDIKLQLQTPRFFISGLKFNGSGREWFFTNTGVEHTCAFFDDISVLSVRTIGEKIRNDSFFAKGTNVNFIRRMPGNLLEIRTYERGVEDETKACGTGIAASAFTDMMLTGDRSPRKAVSALGYSFSVMLTNDRLYLTGPAELVFKGTI